MQPIAWKRNDAISKADERIATQRSCHENRCWYSIHSFFKQRL